MYSVQYPCFLLIDNWHRQVEPNHQLMERIEGAIENLRSNAIATLVPNYTNQISSFSSIPCGPR